MLKVEVPIMKKRFILPVLCICLCAGITGCGTDSSNTAALKDTKSNVCSTEISTGTDSADSDWDILTQQDYSFPVYNSAFYSQDYGITVGYDGEIHYTTDGGSNWPQAENTSMCRWGMDIVNENISYTCGNGAQVTKSTDGGKTFARAADFGGTEPNQCTMMSFADENNGIIASAKRLAVTADGAATWKELKTPSEIAAIRMTDASTFYFVGADFQIYKTTDAGQTWASTSMNLPDKENYKKAAQTFALSVDGKDSYTVYCFGKKDAVLKCYSTTDNWKTCTEHPMPEVSVSAHLYLSNTGDTLTVNATMGKSAIVLVRR